MSEPLDDLDALRRAIAAHRSEGRKIINHFNRLEKEYSDWEDRLIKIENAIQEAENITGLNKEEIVKETDPIGDLLG